MNSEKVFQRRVIDLIHEKAGFSVFVTPLSHMITVVFEKPKYLGDFENEPLQLDFDTFLARFPPFEPISLYGGRFQGLKLTGNYVWFVNVEELDNKKFEYIKKRLGRLEKEFNVKCDDILCGTYEDVGEKIILEKVLIPSVVSEDGGYTYLETCFRFPNSQKMTIYYGYHIIQNKEELLEEIRKKETERGYSPTTLNYVTFCEGGWIVSTDPLARSKKCVACDDRRKIFLCKNYPGYGIFHYRRRIFPKIYPKVENDISSTTYEVLDKHYSLPYTLLLLDRINISKDVRGFEARFENIGRIELNLKKRISTGYFNTNSFLVVLSKGIIKSFIEVLRTSRDYAVTKVFLNSKTFEIPLYNLILSKYMWFKIFRGDFDLELKINGKGKESHFALSLVGKKGSFDILSGLENIEKYMIEIESDKEKFEKFVSEVLMHTLAHAIYISAVNRMPDSREYIDYMYIPEVRDYAVAGIVENTKNGMLRISQEFARSLVGDNSVGGSKSLNPSILREIVKDVEVEDPKFLKHERVMAFDTDEFIENVSSLIIDKIRSENGDQGKLDKQIVRLVVKRFYDLLNNTVEKMLTTKIYVDVQTFTYGILWHILRNKKYIVSELGNMIKKEFESKLAGKIDEAVVEDVLEAFFDAELDKVLIEKIFPDICMDGCALDVYLPNCHSPLDQPLTISRCLMAAFLEFAGVSAEKLKERCNLNIRMECSGRVLQDLALSARRRIYVLTSELGEESLKLLQEILTSNPTVKIILEVDQRLINSKPKLINELKEIAEGFKDRLKLKITEMPHHGKLLDLDNLRIYTSWNFGTSVKPLQTYKSELMCDKMPSE